MNTHTWIKGMAFREVSDKKQNINEKWSLFSDGGWLPAAGEGEQKSGCQIGWNSPLHCFDVNILYIDIYIHIWVNVESMALIFPVATPNQYGCWIWGKISFLCSCKFHCLLPMLPCCCPLVGARPLPGHGALSSWSFHAEMVKRGFESKGCFSMLRHGVPAQFLIYFFSCQQGKNHCIQFMVLTKRGDCLNSLIFFFVMSSAVLLPLF